MQDLVRQILLRGEYEEAIRLVGHDNVKIFRDLGSEFLAEGKKDLCIFCRRTAVALSPTDQVVHFELLRTLFSLGMSGDALAHAVNLDLSVPGVSRHDFTPEEKVIYSLVGDVAIASPELVVNLIRATDYVVSEEIPGAFVECGVFRGGSSMAMMHAFLNRRCCDREFYLYDTFAGMPVPEEIDVYFDGRAAREEWEEKKSSDGCSTWVASTLDETRSLVGSVGYPADKIHYIEGMVEDTISIQAPEQIALLRLDTDFYRSTKHELEHLFPRLSSGGVLIIDDYGAFRGSQTATDEYFQKKGRRPFLHRVDANVRMIIKD